MTVPNALTILRLISAPFILFLLFKGWSEYALMASVLASLTDFFDGKLARALNQESYLGALLDPVADKFFEIILLYFFWTTYDGVLVAYYYFIFVLRNIAQLMSIPILMWWKKIQFKVEPNLTAKLASTWSLLIINLMIILLLLL